jgi:uncharacterized SAM-binding protein YcdF (DUF218 family)
MYAFKQFIGVLTHPGTIGLLLLIAGLAVRRKRPRAAIPLFCLAAVFAWLLSTPLVGGWLLVPLERAYPPLQVLPAQARYVVVLGSSYWPHDGVPITAAIDDAGLKRLVEGIRLQRLLPGSTLVVSGGAASGGYAPATGNARLAQALGVPAGSIVQLLRPLDTRGEAADICALVGTEPFILVTSSSHMPRAMEYMRRAGGNPVAAPTGQQTSMTGFHLASLLPSAQGQRMAEDAIHEYLGWLALEAGFP